MNRRLYARSGIALGAVGAAIFSLDALLRMTTDSATPGPVKALVTVIGSAGVVLGMLTAVTVRPMALSELLVGAGLGMSVLAPYVMVGSTPTGALIATFYCLCVDVLFAAGAVAWCRAAPQRWSVLTTYAALMAIAASFCAELAPTVLFFVDGRESIPRITALFAISRAANALSTLLLAALASAPIMRIAAKHVRRFLAWLRDTSEVR